ncbi:MAG: polymer-forming cytoskeletal protein [Candidatus Paceibacterota bacterium]
MIRLLKEGKFCQIIRRDHEGDIRFVGDVIVCDGVFVRGSISARSGYVVIRSGAVIVGDIYAEIAVEIEERSVIVGDIAFAHALTNHGLIRGNVQEVRHVRNFGEIVGDIKYSSVPNNGWTLISGKASRQARILNYLEPSSFVCVTEK